MDYLHLSGVDFVRDIQIFFVHHEELMLLLSRAGDPRNAFLIYFPLVYGFSKLHGRRLLLAAVLTEWLNIVFKWILFGHRPYWWVHEYKHIHGAEKVSQYPLTCETGPGSPSGHAMVSAAVYYIMIDACKPLLPKWLPHILFLIAMVPINMARIFIAAHFPHQVIAGTLCGVLVTILLDQFTKISSWKLRSYFVAALSLFLGGCGFSWALGQLGVDFHWTVPLALKWCENPKEWVSLSTTPYNSLIRDSTILFGFGLAQSLPFKDQNSGKLYKFNCIVLSLITVNILEMIKFEHPTQLSFYLFSAFKHTLIPIMVVFLIPFLLTSITTQKNSQKRE